MASKASPKAQPGEGRLHSIDSPKKPLNMSWVPNR
uniref:Uncharacterized protein n=1 Tax=Arundo donax TaxID=35708 RepID=A0A0A9BH94_ARUDO